MKNTPAAAGLSDQVGDRAERPDLSQPQNHRQDLEHQPLTMLDSVQNRLTEVEDAN